MKNSLHGYFAAFEPAGSGFAFKHGEKETNFMLNKILLIGNLGRDPEVRYLPNGTPATQFSVAANRKYKVEGELREEVEWFNVVSYGRLAEICAEFLKKGRPVFIEGRVRTRNWTDAQGIRHYRTEVIAEEMRMVGAQKNGNNSEASSPDEHAEPTEPPPDSDPF